VRPRDRDGLGSDADQPEVGDDGRGPPVSLRGTAALSRPSRPRLTGPRWAGLKSDGGCGALGREMKGAAADLACTRLNQTRAGTG
jgi:hypothetical protein